MTHLLLVEDERLLRWALRTRLVNAGHVVDEAATLAEASEHLRNRRPEVVLMDINLPDGNGLDFLADHTDKLSESALLVMTGEGRVEDAVRAMKLGAWDFLPKPIDQTELLRLVEQADASRRQTLEAEGSRRARERQTSVRIVAESEAMKNVLRLAETVAASGSTTVLINGETGVGKEVVARHIHATSPRANAPMHALKCTALPEHLVENELFGHDKRKGLFELADGGTVVLDEISEIPLTLQAKLLRFLEERTFRRLGGTREIAVDVRVLALTSRSLEQRVARSLFREDLFSRLNVFPLTVPPLRERRDDILPLALGFAVQYGAASGKRFTAVAPELQARLLAHPWSGNVRELRNVIERATILEPGPLLNGHSIALQEKIATFEATEDEPIVPLDEVEFVMVRRALRAASGNQSKAARLLQVSRDQLRYRLKRYRDEGRMIEGEE